MHYMGALSPESLFSIRKWKDTREGVKNYNIIVKSCAADGRNITMKIDKALKGRVLQSEMWAWSRSLKKVFRMPAHMEEAEKTYDIEFSVDEFIETCKDYGDRNWELFLVFNMSGTYCQYRFRFKDKKVNKISIDDSDRYILTEGLPDKDGSEGRVFQFYFDNISKFNAKIIPREMMYRGMYRAEITEFDVKGSVLSIKLRQSSRGFENRRIILRHKDDDTGLISEYSFMDDNRAGSNTEGDTESYIIDYNDVIWTPLRYELIMLADKDGYTYEFRIVGNSKEYYDRLSKMYKYSYTNSDNMLIYITETMGKKVVLECRKRNVYDSLRYRLNEKLALLLRPLAYRMNKEVKYLMFYEKFCTAAQDNSYYMFEYFMNHRKHNIRPLYIIEKKRPEYKTMRKEYGNNVIPFMSISTAIAGDRDSRLSCRDSSVRSSYFCSTE